MENNKLNRREFLSFIGLGTASLVASGPLQQAQAFQTTPGRAETTAQAGTTGIEEFKSEIELLAQIRQNIAARFKNREMALDFRRVNAEGELNWLIQIKADELYPVASSFKSFVVLWYFLMTPRDEWVFDLDSDIYRVSIYSNNRLTGSLLTEVAERVEGDGNAVEKFNDFLRDELGLTEGMFSWDWPSSATVGMYDFRFEPGDDRIVEVHGRTEGVRNVFTATELAKGWLYIALAEQSDRWESDPHFQDAILATREILSIPAATYRSPIERVAYGGYTGKDGTLPIGSIAVGRVINDAGIIRVPNGTGQYIISFMSAGEREQFTEPALREVVDSIRIYEDFKNPLRQPTVQGPSAAIIMGQYNYGMVRANETNLYLEPSEEGGKLDNPARRTSTYGTPYLMRGAVIRFLPVNENWGKVIWDDAEDNAWTYTDWTFGFQQANWNQFDLRDRPDIYVPLDKLKVLPYEKFSPIDFVTDATDPDTNKFIILHVPRRELTLFEGITPILKTPVVLNTLETPRGRLYVNRVMITRNMPTYPGVPYTNFLHDGEDLNQIGYAIHGSPWHLWDETVNEWETIRRTSAGCINVPSWRRQIGSYNLPVDEFIFRWIGGFDDPAGSPSYFKRETVHVISTTNPWEELFNYSRFHSMRQARIGWNEILEYWSNKPLDAPKRFFENPHNNQTRASVLNLGASTGDIES
jgi:hypothetical protein